MSGVRIGLSVLVVVVVGCSSGEAIDPELDKLGRATGPAAPSAAHPPMAPPQGGGGPRGDSGAVHEGEVIETMQVPNYTYMLLKTGDGAEVWTAVPRMQMEVGRRVRVAESLVMRDFTSRTLNRTFPSIVFGTITGGAGTGKPTDAGAPSPMGKLPPGGALPPGHPPIPDKGAMPPQKAAEPKDAD